MARNWMKIGVPLALVLVVLSSLACVDKSDKGSDIPQRIVSLSPSNTEILFALGLGDKVVGDTTYCDYPAEAKTKAKIGGFSDVDMEKVMALAPDLVLASDIQRTTVVPQLESRGVKVLTLAPKTLDEVLASISAVGEATGRQVQASQLVQAMRVRIDAVAGKAMALSSPPPRVLYITWHDPLWTAGKGTFVHELIEKSGGRNVFDDADGFLSTGLETIIGRNPQVIVAVAMADPDAGPVHWAQTEERLREVDARRNNRVYAGNDNLISRAGPRIVEGLELMAKCIHPEIFGQPDETVR